MQWANYYGENSVYSDTPESLSRGKWDLEVPLCRHWEDWGRELGSPACRVSFRELIPPSCGLFFRESEDSGFCWEVILFRFLGISASPSSEAPLADFPDTNEHLSISSPHLDSFSDDFPNDLLPLDLLECCPTLDDPVPLLDVCPLLDGPVLDVLDTLGVFLVEVPVLCWLHLLLRVTWERVRRSSELW